MATDEVAAKPVHARALVKRNKAPYAAPTLRVYGTVGQVTAGNAGSPAGMSGMEIMGMSDRAAKHNIIRIAVPRSPDFNAGVTP